MKPELLLEILTTAEKLKCATRHSDTSSGRRESVAEHSWRLALMALLCEDEFPKADMNKVIRMCLIHDLGEAFTGDIPTFEKNCQNEMDEGKLLRQWISSFPEPYRGEWLALLEEMDARESQEAKIYKALDNLEAVIQHNEADIASWLPLEYDLQLTYGSDKVGFAPWMQQFKAAIDCQTREKIAKESKNGSLGSL